MGATVHDLNWDINFWLEIYCKKMLGNVPEKGGTTKKEGILKPDKYCGEMLLNRNSCK